MQTPTLSGLLIKNISPFCLLQDLGRFGYKHYGVTHSGAIDPYLLRVANKLVGNQRNEACLEFTSLGGEFEVTTRSMRIAFAGDFPVSVNGKSALAFSGIYLSQGDVLTIAPATGGIRGYLSVEGGFVVEPELGSCSTHSRSKLGGFAEPLNKGVVLPVKLPFVSEGSEAFLNPSLRRPQRDRIRVVEGPQCEYFSSKGLRDFYAKPFTISNESDRMGYCLDGNDIEFEKRDDMISEPTLYGSVQVPPSGKPIVLMVDCGTSGGYPKIATVVAIDRGLLAQKSPGTEFYFEAISVEQAQDLLRQQEDYFGTLNLRMTRN